MRVAASGLPRIDGKLLGCFLLADSPDDGGVVQCAAPLDSSCWRPRFAALAVDMFADDVGHLERGVRQLWIERYLVQPLVQIARVIAAGFLIGCLIGDLRGGMLVGI